MRIQGLQKLTLLDYPGRTACTVFLSGCNFRCPFCHNAPLLTAADEDGMDEDELLAFLKKRQGLLDGVAVTGGEPLLRPDLPQLLEKIKALGYVIKLDTNGAFPERLEAVVCAGLADYVAMDIKNSPARYAETAGTAELDLAPIDKSVSFLLRAMERLGYRGGRVRIGHCQNEVLAQDFCSELLHLFPQADIKSYPLRGLCSYYAERGGIMLGFEA